ncbi:hypothetical protein Tsp_10777 [Trichinella spiralis]|uniref:hypothetical protein n=1 Tax=Trichinella spiralis TaxID=6334 RepID=UPI0001EFD4ED|nr:hypothetical protein Tsp_10777 [Trichinella spiralis]
MHLTRTALVKNCCQYGLQKSRWPSLCILAVTKITSNLHGTMERCWSPLVACSTIFYFISDSAVPVQRWTTGPKLVYIHEINRADWCAGWRGGEALLFSSFGSPTSTRTLVENICIESVEIATIRPQVAFMCSISFFRNSGDLFKVSSSTFSVKLM